MFTTETTAWKLPYGWRSACPHFDPLHHQTGDERQAVSWSESFCKQEAFIDSELSKPDADHEFWAREKMAMDDAREHVEQLIDPIEKQIQALQEQRKLLLSGISATLVNRHKVCNVATFLERDDPAGYLRW